MASGVIEQANTPFKITVAITQADDSSESATMIDVNATAWLVEHGVQVAECQANLIKREMMRDPHMFSYVTEVTPELEEVAKEYEVFDLELDGSMVPKTMVNYFEKLGLFPEEDYTAYKTSKSLKKHPCNRAWIVYFNTITVGKSFRRRHIGRAIVRKVLEAALPQAHAAGRPLLAGSRPGFLGAKGEVVAESEKFRKAMGFKRYTAEFQPDLFFWGLPRGLPSGKLMSPEVSAGN